MNRIVDSVWNLKNNELAIYPENDSLLTIHRLILSSNSSRGLTAQPAWYEN